MELEANEGAEPRLVGLPPLIGCDPRWLVLGTFPSSLSRSREEYYGNPRNAFWRIMFALADVPFREPSYQEKQDTLASLHIALWDVIASCYVVGAADTAIRDPQYNTGLLTLIESHSSFQGIVFNGGNAASFFRKEFGSPSHIQMHVAPSTSPANARYSFAEKLLRWSSILSSR